MNLLEADLKYIWHPAQQMKDAEVFPPVSDMKITS